MKILKKIVLFISNHPIIFTTIFTALISSIVAVILQSYLNPEPKTIDYRFYKCETSDIVIYMGELKNTQSGHAKDLKLSGALNAEIIDFTINLSSEKNMTFNQPIGTVWATIPKLASGKKITFTIITVRNTDIKEPFTISWGDNGGVQLKLQPCDEKIQMGIDIGNQLSMLSQKARETVVQRNDN